MLMFSFLFPQTSHASDIKKHWAKAEIQELVDRKIMGGYGNETYLPNNNITRAEFTQLVLKSLNIETTSSTRSFKDVQKGNWFYHSVMTAAEVGLVNGTTATTFSPNQAITRQDISVIIMNALNRANISTVESNELFLDERSISPYAKPAVKKLQHLGIVSGKVKGANNKYYFKPRENATRAEAAVMLIRMLKAIEHPNEIIRTVTYDYDFKEMVDKQMASSSRPQTDYRGPWYDASRAMTEHYVNPNNFRNDETSIYQFLVLSGSSGISAQKLNEHILYNKGILKGTANAFIRASKAQNINEVYLISHAILETGNGTSKLASGIEVGLNKDNKPTMVTTDNRSELKNIKKTYNMFGIGAYDQCANECGSERAYTSGWFTVEDAILGGAAFISKDYIGAGQDTIYKMRWNPEKPASHQYATDVGWATKQTNRIKTMFELINGMGGHPLVFEIPTFKNQPKLSAKPSGEAMFNVDKKLEGKKAFAMTDNLQVRSGPHANFTALGHQLIKGEEVTIIGQNKNWYKVKTSSTDGWLLDSQLNIPDQKNRLVEISELFRIEEDSEHLEAIRLATVNEDQVPLYTESSFDSEVIAELNTGTEVMILDENEEAYKVYVNDGTSTQTGWIYKQYIAVN